jgi:uncharacterized membrane protein/predicted DsbA family dithiol-disulfide isomerase
LALIVSAFLAFIGVGAMVAASTAKVPYCSWASWLDCTAVLNHPRWSKWWGIPVGVPATLIYVWALLLLMRPNLYANERAWKRLGAIGVAIVLAAGWFLFLQLQVIGKACAWCMVEHAIGVTLAILIWANRRPRLSSLAIGAVMAAVLIGGQLLQPMRFTSQIAIGQVVGLKYEEPLNGQPPLLLAQGAVSLNPAAHPRIGSLSARKLLVEAVDYTCPRCHMLWQMLKPALPLLGEDYGVAVLTFPLNHRCNHYYTETEPRHEPACDLARLAHALWLVDPAQFHAFHDWLFENQDKVDAAAAQAEAERRVGAEPLRKALARGEMEAMINRDIEIAYLLGVRQLPGLFAKDEAVVIFPDDPEKLAQVLRHAMEKAPGPMQ